MMKRTYNIKEKFQDWFYITYYKIKSISIRRFWDNLRRWFAYYKVIRNTYDFDYISLLEVELHQLVKLRDCISKYQSYVNSWRDIRNMNWAIKCLEIVLENGCAYSNGEKGFFTEGPNEKGYYELIPNPAHKYIMPIYVNTKNYKRFWPAYESAPSEIEDLNKDFLRIEKAWCLYHKIRKEYTRNWWD